MIRYFLHLFTNPLKRIRKISERLKKFAAVV